MLACKATWLVGMEITSEQIRASLESNPTLTLLKAYSRDWVLPLFAEHLKQVDGSVSAEWCRARVRRFRRPLCHGRLLGGPHTLVAYAGSRRLVVGP